MPWVWFDDVNGPENFVQVDKVAKLENIRRPIEGIVLNETVNPYRIYTVGKHGKIEIAGSSMIILKTTKVQRNIQTENPARKLPTLRRRAEAQIRHLAVVQYRWG